MPRNVPCKFHLQGRCSRGESCNFYHGPAPEPKTPEVCKFFVRGFCAAGTSCRFLHPWKTTEGETSQSDAWATDKAEQHEEHQQDGNHYLGYSPSGQLGEDAQEDGYWWPDDAAEAYPDGSQDNASDEEDPYDEEAWELWATTQTGPEWKDRSLCPYFQSHGRCPKWRTCAQPHGRLCEICERWCLHPYNQSQRQSHIQLCSERADRAASRAATEAQECCICLERVMDKPFSERKFGLLACEHAFCLRCVRDWRSQVDGGADLDTALRTCPLCRQASHFVTPSKVWPRTPEEKARIIEEYKEKLASIDCKYWENSPASDRRCPFGTSCFYRHKGAEDMAAPRKFLSADGEVKFSGPVHLSEFLSNLGL